MAYLFVLSSSPEQAFDEMIVIPGALREIVPWQALAGRLLELVLALTAG